MARMTKRKWRLLFEGEMLNGQDGHLDLQRHPSGTLSIGTSAFSCGTMALTAEQAVAVRKFLEATE